MVDRKDPLPVVRQCQLLAVPRSTFYYPRQGIAEADLALMRLIDECHLKHPYYGSRRIRDWLEDRGHAVNRKRVQRLMRLMDLQAQIQRRKRRTTNSEHDFPRYPNLVQDLAVVQPEQVWVADITYVHLQSDFVYLAVLMDVFTRAIRGWHLGRSLDHTLTLAALREALEAYPAPQIHHSDQGIQYAATAYTETLQAALIGISMAEVGEAWQNGYAERLIRTIKEEAVDLSEYRDYNDAYRQIGRFLDDVYMHKRIHSSLGYLTPVEFETKWRREHTLALEVELRIA
jgi:putative transposase